MYQQVKLYFLGGWNPKYNNKTKYTNILPILYYIDKSVHDYNKSGSTFKVWKIIHIKIIQVTY